MRKVAGTASFSGRQLEFTPTGGSLKGIKLNGGSLLLTNLGEPVEWLTIDLGLAGPLQDVLEVIDAKPLQLCPRHRPRSGAGRPDGPRRSFISSCRCSTT